MLNSFIHSFNALIIQKHYLLLRNLCLNFFFFFNVQAGFIYLFIYNSGFIFIFLNFILFLNFTILYWFCQISKWIHHRYTCVSHPEPSSLLPPHTIPLGHPIAPAPSIQYRASNLDWRLISYMILYMFQSILPNLPTLSLSHRVHKTVLYISPLLLSRIQGYCYHLSKFHIYALVYCIGVFLSGLLHSA